MRFFSHPSDGKIGSKHSNGTWNGMINNLINNYTQIGILDFALTFERSIVVDFSPPILEGKAKMFIKTPGKDQSWTSFLKPFSLKGMVYKQLTFEK